MKLTPDEYRDILKRPAIARRNQADTAGICAVEPKHIEGSALVGIHAGEKDSGSCVGGGAETRGRFRITFRVFSTRPCDYDNYHIKELQDLVVRAGILPCDDWDVLQGEVVSLKAETKKEERTEITIERLFERLT